MMNSLPIVIAVVWIAAHFALYVGARLRAGNFRDDGPVLSYHLVSALGLTSVVLFVAVRSWNADAVAAVAAAIALHGIYSAAFIENRALVDRCLGSFGLVGKTDGDVAGAARALGRLDAFLRGRSRLVSLGALAALFAAVAWYLLLRPTYAAAFLEYYQKYLPFLTDRGLHGILDFAVLGDTRPRLLPLLGAALNVAVRRVLLLRWTIHPSFGLSWLIYPAATAALSRAVFLLTGRRSAAVIAGLLYAASPGQLDILVDYYIPAKALLNLFFATALIGAGLSDPHLSLRRLPRPWLGTGIIFASALAGLLSDETAGFILSTVGLLLTPLLFARRATVARRLAAPAALLAALMVYVWIGFVALPSFQERHGYIAVSLATVILRGGTTAMFGTPAPFGGLLHTFDPLRLFETIIAAHTVFGRLVEAGWTSLLPVRHIWEVRPSDYGQYLAVLGGFAVLLAALRRDQRRLAWLIMLAFAFFIWVQSIMIYSVAPWVVEVNYYASLSSVFVALLGAILLGDLAERRGYLALACLAVAWLCLTSFHNFLETAKRHPGFSDAPLTWAELREARARALSGALLHLPDTADPGDPLDHRGRIYLYALEAAMGQQHRLGRQVDIGPLQPIATAPLYQTLHLETMFDPRVVRLAAPGPATLAEAVHAGAASVASGVDWLRGRHLRGSTAEWNVDLTVAPSAAIRGKAWRPGLIRLWVIAGAFAAAGEGDCLIFAAAPKLCMATTVAREGTLFAYDPAGRWVLSFRLVP